MQGPICVIDIPQRNIRQIEDLNSHSSIYHTIGRISPSDVHTVVPQYVMSMDGRAMTWTMPNDVPPMYDVVTELPTYEQVQKDNEN